MTYKRISSIIPNLFMFIYCINVVVTALIFTKSSGCNEQFISLKIHICSNVYIKKSLTWNGINEMNIQNHQHIKNLDNNLTFYYSLLMFKNVLWSMPFNFVQFSFQNQLFSWSKDGFHAWRDEWGFNVWNISFQFASHLLNSIHIFMVWYCFVYRVWFPSLSIL